MRTTGITEAAATNHFDLCRQEIAEPLRDGPFPVCCSAMNHTARRARREFLWFFLDDLCGLCGYTSFSCDGVSPVHDDSVVDIGLPAGFR